MTTRKPRSGEEALEQMNAFLDRQLPTYVKKLGDLAAGGDRQALVYLVDRRLGKPMERRDDGSERFLATLEAMARSVGSQSDERTDSADLRPEADGPSAAGAAEGGGS
jgi:hypothetical protein